MASELTTVFVPLINETRMGEYLPGEFQLTPRQNDTGIDINFIPSDLEDQSIYMVAPGEVFFIAAGTSSSFLYGPEVAAPIDKNVVVMHVVSTYKWAPILASMGQPVAEWWAFEGITTLTFEQFLDSHDLDALAAPRRFINGGELRAAILSGDASLNVLLVDEQPVSLGSLDIGTSNTVTLGLRAWASYDTGLAELDAKSALATIKPLAPGLADHPLLVQVLSDISTSDVTIHVRFVFWKTKRDPNNDQVEIDATSETDKGQFSPVPPGSRISLQKRSPGPVYAPIIVGTVVDNGQVALIARRADLSAVNLTNGESLVFRVDLPAGTRFETQYQHARTPRALNTPMVWGIFNDAWVTERRSTIDEAIDNLDFLVAYENTVVGSVTQPIEYFAGIPVFLQVKYPVIYVAGAGATAKFNEVFRKAPKGIKVELLDATQTILGTFFTDEHGQIWGTLLNGYDNLQLSFEIVVRYEIVDSSIGLLPIKGEVVLSENPFTSTNSYSSTTDIRNTTTFITPQKTCLGKPFGTSTATHLATLQVGFVSIGGTAVSDFSSADGRHAGVLHALQQLRYIHQWFHHLTDGFELNNQVESWSSILARHRQGQGKWVNNSDPTQQNYTIELPIVRVSPPSSVLPEDVFGEATDVELPSSDPNKKTRAWCLTLYGYNNFAMNSTLAGNPVALENKAQFWRVHTIWHEFTHAVVNMALQRLFTMETHIGMNASKDGSTSGRVHEVIFDSLDATNNNFPLGGGWSTLEEGLAAVPEAALQERASGTQPFFFQRNPTSPLIMIVNINSAGVSDKILDPNTDLDLSQGMNVNFDPNLGPPAVNDQRLGLRVPIAFTWALWTAFKNVGGFSETLQSHVTGDQVLNDLMDKVGYLKPAHIAIAQRIFRALFWGPLIALRTPDMTTTPPQWNDLIRPTFGPTTFRFLQTIETQFWNELNAAEKTAIKDLFGSANNPESFYLWFSFP